MIFSNIYGLSLIVKSIDCAVAGSSLFASEDSKVIVNLVKPQILSSMYFFFFLYQGFLSRTLTIHRTAGEGWGPFFIPLYHIHPLTNIQTFMCNFAREMAITYF